MALPVRKSELDPLILGILENHPQADEGFTLGEIFENIDQNKPGEFSIRGAEKRASKLANEGKVTRVYRWKMIDRVETNGRNGKTSGYSYAHQFPVRYYRYFSNRNAPRDNDQTIVESEEQHGED